MKVTKYPQSCLLIEKDGHSIAIDPGSYFTQKYGRQELGPVEAVLYTHQHGDHLDTDLADELRAAGVPLYGNADVAAKLGGEMTVVHEAQPFGVAGFQVTPHDLPHFIIRPGQEPVQNTGYVINGTFFHPGDSTEINGLSVHDVGAPVGNPKGNDGALELAHSLQAKRIIPIHNANHEYFSFDEEKLKTDAEPEFEVILLDDGESTEL
jgi:L-ascorbate metabolism protein UlaG (beta-lactamase superfamily)